MTETILTLKCLAYTGFGVSFISVIHEISCWCV